jgi:hypothetical protein
VTDGATAAASTIVARLADGALRIERAGGVAAIGFEGVPLRRSEAACF